MLPYFALKLLHLLIFVINMDLWSAEFLQLLVVDISLLHIDTVGYLVFSECKLCKLVFIFILYCTMDTSILYSLCKMQNIHTVSFLCSL